MSNEKRDSGQKVSPSAQRACHFIWPLSKSPTTPDEMNTSFGPRIDADRWDFHDGIDLPAAVGTPVHAMADGMVHRAGRRTSRIRFSAQRMFFSKSSIQRTDKDDLFLVYLHLDSIAEGVIPGAHVKPGRRDRRGGSGRRDLSPSSFRVPERRSRTSSQRSPAALSALPQHG